MNIDHNISKFIVFTEETVLHALHKISKNKKRIVFAVSESGHLDGLLTDGDIRRWLQEQSLVDLEKPIKEVVNRDFEYRFETALPEEIESLFSERIEYIPLLDSQFRLVAVASQKKAKIVIGDLEISEESQAFIIAEIGNNHNGNVDFAKHLVDEAKKAGANCAKFQMRSMDSLYKKNIYNENKTEDLGTEYTLDLLAKFQLKDNELFEIFDYCHKNNIIPLCTPWDNESFDKLNSYGMQGYKIASADLTNHDLLKAVILSKKPVICSTGMSKEDEIKSAVSIFQKKGAQYILLHCNSTYPAPYTDINLFYLNRLKKIGNCLVGYSGHERGFFIPVAAIALGARVIEKHITMDRSMQGNDHKVSLLPDEFKEMVRQIRLTELALGGLNQSRCISQGELINRENLAKSLISSNHIKKNHIITEVDIEICSPGKGLSPAKKKHLIGKPSKRDIEQGDFFFESDIDDSTILPRKYKFSRPFGIPVRFHDLQKLLTDTTAPDFVEFHLSYKDLEVDLKNIQFNDDKIGFMVHSPELFYGDHILDLCSSNEDYRMHSLHELNRVIQITRKLKTIFTKTKRPIIIVNAGGFTTDHHIEDEERVPLYAILEKSLQQITLTDVEIIIQTMPPFPWHFGGQRFHNLFVCPDEIVSFCLNNNVRICLDISHSQLACNHYNWSMKEFLNKVLPYTAHLHIADATGIDGEGLQINSGNIVFSSLCEQLNKLAPNISFIPEIWQGHKNNGEGFWFALDKLEKWL